MSPRSLVAVVTALLLLAGAAPAAALTGVAPGPSGDAGAQANALPHNGSLDPGEVEMRIDVAANGNARWRVKAVIADDADPETFADLVDQFNQSESPLGLDGYRAAAENASQASGRQMEIRNVERHHALHNGTGALWITFTWTNFARTSGDRLSVDDGFNTSSGVWLPLLSESETLVVAPPDGYGVSSAPTGSRAAPSSLSDGVARWEGPQDFGQRGPWIVYSGDAPTPTPTPTTTPPNGTSDGGPGTSPGGPGPDGEGLLSDALPLIVLIVLAGVIAAVLAANMRSGDDGLGALVGSDGGDDGTTAESVTEPASENGDGASVDRSSGGTTSASENGSEPGDATAGTAGATAAGAGTSAADGTNGSTAESDEDPDDEIDEELLSDEERVERLIERNGGRMKQAAIVQETGWSNAKVSQLLSAMDEDGRIDKLRIGRENLISFPDEDVADLDSE